MEKIEGASWAPTGRFEALFDQMPFSMQVLHPSGRTLRVNRAWKALWQVEEEGELLQWILSSYNILEDRQLEAAGILPYLHRAFAGETVSMPAVLYDPAVAGKPGRLRWCRGQAHPVLAQDGSVAEVLLIHEDVTAQLQAQQAARDSEMRLHQLANTIPQLAWMADPDGDVHWYNERWFAYTGTTLQQLREQGWQIVHDPERLAEVVRHWEASLRTGEPFQMTLRLRGRDGRFRPFFTLVAPLKDDAGRVLQWFGTNTDVTELQQAETRMRSAEERLRLATEAAGVGTWEMDLATGRGTWSAEARAILRTPLSECTLDDWGQVIHPADREATTGAWLRAIERGLPYEVEFRLAAPAEGGEERWVLSRGRVEQDAGGRPLRGLGVVLDITTQRRFQEALVDSERRLRAADERKNEFLAMLAHELRNPLAPVRNAMHLLHRDGGDTARRAELLALMERQLAHMVRLVDDLLEVSRITRGQIRLVREVLDLRGVVREAAEAAAPWLLENRQRLELDLPPHAVPVEADPVRLAQVVGNLLNNAGKYTPASGSIRVGLRREAGWAVVCVSDNGLGIPAEMLERVFELFTQVPASRHDAQGGLGIGLAMVKRLVELHGGSVCADSAGVGQGTRVTFRLPLAAAVVAAPPPLPLPPPAAAVAVSAAKEPAVVAQRILVVDDNRDAVDTLGLLLALEGAEVRTAYDGEQALEIARDFAPRAVLLDIGLPGIDGHETARRLRQQPGGRDAVLVALTGWGQEEDRRRASQAGFDAHLVKPVDPARLLEVLGQLLGAGG